MLSIIATENYANFSAPTNSTTLLNFACILSLSTESIGHLSPQKLNLHPQYPRLQVAADLGAIFARLRQRVARSTVRRRLQVKRIVRRRRRFNQNERVRMCPGQQQQQVSRAATSPIDSTRLSHLLLLASARTIKVNSSTTHFRPSFDRAGY